MTTRTVAAWPLNSAGEIVCQQGTGDQTIVGYVGHDQLPTDTSTGKIVVNFPDLDGLVLDDVLTGFASATGSITAADTLIGALGKLYGNDALKALNLLTGYVSGAGAVAASDTVLQGVNKLNGNAVANMVKTEQLLFVLRSADMQLNTDQQLVKQFTGTQYRITDVVGVRKTGAASVTCAGGIYTAASKGGTPLVANTQDWVSLASSVIVTATKEAAVNTTILTTTPYLSLTTGSTAACTADIFVYGYIID